jgi:diguanylate cyclase (GGDEF)-like protein
MNLAARYGGDEFITVLTDVPRTGAEKHARRIELRVASHPELSKHGLTVSYGVAEFDPIKMFEVEDLVLAADRDLYRVKNAREPQGEDS